VRPKTVFVGGGTPTALAPEDLARFFEIIDAHVDRSRVVEFSVEANPEDLDSAKIACLAAAGVNRVNLGVQSFQPDVLETLGRAHDADRVRDSVRRIRAAKIPRIGLDLIFGVPGQSRAGLDADIDALLALAPDHISTYGLTYEPGTALTRARDRGDVVIQDEDDELALYRRLRERLAAAGFEHYEVSNFARPGARCRHNLTYWRDRSHLGVGPSAVSFMDGERRKNLPGLAAWCAALERGEDPVGETERLTPAHALRERVMVALRLRHGIRLDQLRRASPDLDGLDLETVGRLREQHLLTDDPNRLELTERGLELSDYVTAELL